MGALKLVRDTCKLLDALDGGTRRGLGRAPGQRNPGRPRPPADGSEPPCELETFLFPDGGSDIPGALPTGYQHPSETLDED